MYIFQFNAVTDGRAHRLPRGGVSQRSQRVWVCVQNKRRAHTNYLVFATNRFVYKVQIDYANRVDYFSRDKHRP